MKNWNKRIAYFTFYMPFLMANLVFGQNSLPDGTYMNASQEVSLQLKKDGENHYGLMSSMYGSFVIVARRQGNLLKGHFVSQEKRLEVKGIIGTGNLNVEISGHSELFSFLQPEHELDQFDFAPYVEAQKKMTTDTAQPKIANTLFDLIAGSQISVYTRTSYVSDSNASSLNYYNFCANGYFFVNYDGSFSVEGYGGNAHGATYGSSTGKWKIYRANGQDYISLIYGNGSRNDFVLNEEIIRRGRWRNGNTQYALQRNKVFCGN
ncbi:hypothetical protein [Flagellimonas allohymeniacidonis]|uniref:Uncharacterized protein n=1 Tax=Flagellimonas allohymeniacidonis TaxID=2517819 RepID=A0A4Q8QMN8_9FLAO|nr:hypothetical protein [Allomuricauda hymeniacidonis]TAI49576.1 hypothetical protein EW142_07200 [Allomuricauda hymeniacidonis]